MYGVCMYCREERHGTPYSTHVLGIVGKFSSPLLQPIPVIYDVDTLEKVSFSFLRDHESSLASSRRSWRKFGGESV